MSSRDYEHEQGKEPRTIANANNTNQSRIPQIRSIDNSIAINQMVRITTVQVSINSFVDNFFNGTVFKTDNNLEPAGFLGSSFP
jgi:hypothetical protein